MYTLITSFEDIKPLFKDIEDTLVIGYDTETTSLDPYTATLLLIQFHLNDKIYIIDVRKTDKKLVKYIIELLEDSNKPIISHNSKFDLKMTFHNTGVMFTNVHCTMVTEAILYAGLGRRYTSFKDLAQKYCAAEGIDKDIRKEFIDMPDDEEISQEALNYAATDVVYLERIYWEQLKKIEKEKLDRTYNLEMQLLPAVTRMEYNGVAIDVPEWKRLTEIAEKAAKEQEEKFMENVIDRLYDEINPADAYKMFIHLSIPVNTKKFRAELELVTYPKAVKDLVWSYLNLSSPLQLKSVLNILGFDVKDTNAKTLKKLNDPLIDDLLSYRSDAKLVSSFGGNFLLNINPISGKVHGSFHQMGTATGRFSSSDPNLQNIVRSSDYRHCFIADEGYVMITADYSQAELRLLGDVSREPLFINAYKNNDDLHLLTASRIFEVPPDKVTKEQRQIGKNINFATVYGSTEYGLYHNFGIPIDDGRKFLKRFHESYPTLSRFMEIVGELIYKNLYALTPLGRKRYFEKNIIYKDHWKIRQEKEKIIREGINHIIQGGSADITKTAIVKTYYENPFGDDFKQLLTVHDEIVFMVKEEIKEQAIEFIKDKMNEAAYMFMKFTPNDVGVACLPYWSK